MQAKCLLRSDNDNEPKPESTSYHLKIRLVLHETWLGQHSGPNLLDSAFRTDFRISHLLPNLADASRRVTAQNESVARLDGGIGLAIRPRIRPKLPALLLQ